MNRPSALLALVLSTSMAPAAAAPGAAFIGAKGVHRIDDTGKVSTVFPDRLAPMTMTVADGEPWVSTVDGKIHRSRPGKAVQLPGTDDVGRWAVAMTPAAKGGIWALGRGRVFRISPTLQLSAYPLPIDRLLGEASILEVGDNVWVASQHGLFRFAAGKWETIRPGWYEHLARDSTGIVWTVAKKNDAPDLLVGFDGKQWIEAPIEGQGVAALAAGQGGRIYVLVWGRGWVESRIDVLTTVSGKPLWTARRLGDVTGLRHLAVDGTERLWSSLRHGLVVLDKEGRRLADLPQGSVPGLVGIVRRLAAAGAGPTRLPSPLPIGRGSVTGRIMKSRTEPLAGIRLEVCVGDCLDGSPKFPITTDAAGRFRADDVAAIEYGSILDTRGGTNVVHDIGNFTLGGRRGVQRLECCTRLAAGRTLDLGTIDAPTPPTP